MNYHFSTSQAKNGYYTKKKRGLKSHILLIDGRRKPIDEKNAG